MTSNKLEHVVYSGVMQSILARIMRSIERLFRNTAYTHPASPYFSGWQTTDEQDKDSKGAYVIEVYDPATFGIARFNIFGWVLTVVRGNGRYRFYWE